jgi:Divergent InlB B-repeat domain
MHKPSRLLESPAPLFLSALLLVLAISSSCSSDSTPSNAACSPQNCSGCCSSTGQCEVGTSTSACGESGATCSICTGTQACTNALCVPAGPIFDAGPTNDAGPGGFAGFVLNVNNYLDWCSVQVNSAPPIDVSGTYTFDAGTVVTLHATGLTGFTFDYWLGTDGVDAGGLDQNASTTITMDSDVNVLACCDNVTEKCPTSLSTPYP